MRADTGDSLESDPQGVPLIFQFFADGIGTLPILNYGLRILGFKPESSIQNPKSSGLPRFHRAVPSTALDELRV
jgi:hypothetical protein